MAAQLVEVSVEPPGASGQRAQHVRVPGLLRQLQVPHYDTIYRNARCDGAVSLRVQAQKSVVCMSMYSALVAAIPWALQKCWRTKQDTGLKQ